MLVVFVVGLIAALAMPNLVIEDDKQKLRGSAQNLLTLMRLQEEEAILTGTQRGLRLSRQDSGGSVAIGYQWMVWSADNALWLEAPNQMRQLQGALKGVFDLVLLIEGQPVVVAEAAGNAGNADSGEPGIEGSGGAKALPAPQIVIYSSGDITDFELNLLSADAGASITLVGGYEGFSLRDDDEDAAAD